MTARKGNMFAIFQEEEEGEPGAAFKDVKPKQQQQRPKTAKDSDKIRVPRKTDDDQGEFSQVERQERTQTRGGRGGQRGGRGRGGEGRGRGRARGERREGGEGGATLESYEVDEGEGRFRGRGEYRGRGGESRYRGGEYRPRGRGEGRGRGRGNRPYTTEGVDPNAEGGEVQEHYKEKQDLKKENYHYEGDQRQKWHPYDRKSGTGRGRDVKKSGHGKGNVGTAEDDIKLAEGAHPALAEEETKEGEAKPKKEEGVKAEEMFADKEEEEEEEKGLTIEEYMAQKKTAGYKKEARKPEEIKKTNIEKGQEKQKITTIESKISNTETYNASVAQSKENVLLGFQGESDYYERRGRGRGRGEYRGEQRGEQRGEYRGRGGQPGGKRQGGRGGQQSLEVDDKSFPTL